MIHAIRHITDLDVINSVEKASKSLALADTILMPEWEYRYFSFHSNWDSHEQAMMASMRDGSGSEYFIHFSKEGVLGKFSTKSR